MGVVACCAYPIMNFVARLTINDSLLWFKPLCYPEKIQDSNLRFYSVSITFTLVALLTALFVPTINAVISVLGSVFSILFIFLFPSKNFIILYFSTNFY
jgi:hypothetical protein